ncbi:MAG: helix-turn-helix domain-containing protein [Acidimicrobiales bacterium]|nr:helix-turn-helix domain-containing protein [Acidimicrobiales bacterium]
MHGNPGSRLEVLKALGDNTRYAIYLELARAPVPLSTSDIADTLDLHPNTVRPHLERMREVGLLEVETRNAGTVGRPQNLYSLAPDAPSLGLEPPVFRMAARMLAAAAARAGVDPDDAAEVGREQGRADALARTPPAPRTPAPSCLEALVAELTDLGFDPAVAGELDAGGDVARVAFTHCPFRELAEAHPELVCSLHRGMVEGFVDAVGGAQVEEFHTLAHREPCQVELTHG